MKNDIEQLLKKMTPAAAPRSLEEKVLAEARERANDGPPQPRSLGGFFGTVAAIAAMAVIAVSVILAFPEYDESQSPEGGAPTPSVSSEEAELDSETREKLVAARASVLELKLSRLRQKAPKDRLDLLRSLQDELDRINETVSNGNEEKKNENGNESFLPTGEGGKKHVKDNSDRSLLACDLVLPADGRGRTAS